MEEAERQAYYDESSNSVWRMKSEGLRLAQRILTPEQLKRLYQIERQSEGLEVSAELVRISLNLTKAQLYVLGQLKGRLEEERDEVFGSPDFTSPDNRDRMIEQMEMLQERQDELMDEFVETFSDEQMAVWVDLVGPRF